jgi:hypothetical protein
LLKKAERSPFLGARMSSSALLEAAHRESKFERDFHYEIDLRRYAAHPMRDLLAGRL